MRYADVASCNNCPFRHVDVDYDSGSDEEYHTCMFTRNIDPYSEYYIPTERHVEVKEGSWYDGGEEYIEEIELVTYTSVTPAWCPIKEGLLINFQHIIIEDEETDSGTRTAGPK